MNRSERRPTRKAPTRRKVFPCDGRLSGGSGPKGNYMQVLVLEGEGTRQTRRGEGGENFWVRNEVKGFFISLNLEKALVLGSTRIMRVVVDQKLPPKAKSLFPTEKEVIALSARVPSFWWGGLGKKKRKKQLFRSPASNNLQDESM